jgi:hypothetical protein
MGPMIMRTIGNYNYIEPLDCNLRMSYQSLLQCLYHIFYVLCITLWVNEELAHFVHYAALVSIIPNEEPARKLTQKVALTHNSHPERATTSFQMRHSQGMMFPIALSTSSLLLSCVSAPRIGCFQLVLCLKINTVTLILEGFGRILCINAKFSISHQIFRWKFHRMLRQCFLLPKSCRKLYTDLPAIRRQPR